jgi:Flp pilus assembly protein TadG
MKKFLTYYKNRKGITIVMVALMLFLLLALLGMAVDIAQMYFAKNQLQVAADAAALAGAGVLDGSALTLQTPARTSAWQFGCKNHAASNPKNVYLVAADPQANDPSATEAQRCDNVPTDLNDANNPNGDIVLGYWNPSLTPAFTPIIPTGQIANAVKVVARRTGETPGMPAVRVFIGQIFRFLSTDPNYKGWAFMSARASAIAAMPPRASAFISMGNTACLASDVSSPPCANPTVCNISPPRVLQPSPSTSSLPGDQKFGWTTLLGPPGNCNDLRDLMCSNSPYQDACGTTGINGFNGECVAATRALKSLMYDPNHDRDNKEIVGGNVNGWWVMIPQENFLDPMKPPPPDPRPILGHILIRIRGVCASGVGGGAICPSSPIPPSNSAIPGCGPGDNQIIIDRISCIPCGSTIPGLKPVLVR